MVTLNSRKQRERDWMLIIFCSIIQLTCAMKKRILLWNVFFVPNNWIPVSLTIIKTTINDIID